MINSVCEGKHIFYIVINVINIYAHKPLRARASASERDYVRATVLLYHVGRMTKDSMHSNLRQQDR